MDDLTIYAVFATLNWLFFWRRSKVEQQRCDSRDGVISIMQNQRDDALQQVWDLERQLAIATAERSPDE
jgi:hypothetical protein